jgi:O-methyltransferase
MKSNKRIIYPYSRISKLPKSLQGIALLLRSLKIQRHRYQHKFNGVATSHNLSVLNTPRFKYALENAISAGGFDYQIYMRQHQAIFCADVALSLHENGSFVELGTGKGYTMITVLSGLEFRNIDLSTIPVFLFDSFSSSATDKEGLQNSSFGKNIYYAESFGQVQNNFSLYPNVTLIQGTLPQSLYKFDTGPISFLHIDLNAPEVEIECLKFLWDRVQPGGIILIDDYAHRGFEYTNLLFDTFAEELGLSILTTPYGPGIMIKPATLTE